MGNTVSKFGKTALEVACFATGGHFGISDEGFHIGPLRMKKNRISVRFQHGPVNIGVAIGKKSDGTWTTDADIVLGIKGRAGVNLKAHCDSNGNFSVEPEGFLKLGPLQASMGFKVDNKGNFDFINAEVGTSIGSGYGTIGVNYENDRSWSVGGNINIKKPGKGDFKVGYHVDRGGNWSGDASLGIQSGTIEGTINTTSNKIEGFSGDLEAGVRHIGNLDGYVKMKVGMNSNMKRKAEKQIEKQTPGEMGGRIRGKLDRYMKWETEIEVEKRKFGELSGRVKGKLDSDMKWDTELEVEKRKPGGLGRRVKGKLDSDMKWETELELEKNRNSASRDGELKVHLTVI